MVHVWYIIHGFGAWCSSEWCKMHGGVVIGSLCKIPGAGCSAHGGLPLVYESSCLAHDAVYMAFGEHGGPPLKPGAWLLMQFTWRCISGPAPTEASVRPWASHRSPFWCNTETYCRDCGGVLL